MEQGRKYRLTVDFVEGAEADVLLRWSRMVAIQLPRVGNIPRIDSRPMTPEDPVIEFEGTPSMALVQVTLRTKEPAREVCRKIRLEPLLPAGAVTP